MLKSVEQATNIGQDEDDDDHGDEESDTHGDDIEEEMNPNSGGDDDDMDNNDDDDIPKDTEDEINNNKGDDNDILAVGVDPKSEAMKASVKTVYERKKVLFLLMMTSARDPGIVPRALHPPEEEFSYDTSAPSEAGGRHTPSLQFPRTKEVTVNGMPVKIKYCDTCMVYRPPRCSHCSICNNCVERFDHHCPWVGQCIGQRNYRWFFLFVSSSTLLCVYVFAISVLYIKFLMNGDYPTVGKAMKESPASVALMLYCFISLWFVGGLTGFHLYLIGTNQTTYENFRYRSDSRPNVYDRGCANNFAKVFCVITNRSRNEFRSFVKEESARPPAVSRASLAADHQDELVSDPRAKVEDDLELGGDLLKISYRIDESGRRVSDGSRGNVLESELPFGPEERLPVVRGEGRYSSWRRRSGSWDVSPDILGGSSSRLNERGNSTQKEKEEI